MQVKKINNEESQEKSNFFRPQNFNDFIGQEDIKKVIISAIQSAQKRSSNLGHILFSGESGYGKTSLAGVIANDLGVNIKIITAYAITKPAEMVSILNSLEKDDILFVDEIHRLRPNLEEILYIAMEDFSIDMVLPEGGSIRIPINPFCLIGATTKLENISVPLKNRFVYKFHFCDYNEDEKKNIIRKYLNYYQVNFDDKVVSQISDNVVCVPREINNFCYKLRDYLISKGVKDKNMHLDMDLRNEFKTWAKVIPGGLSEIHQRYLDILSELGGGPIGVKTISLRLGLNEKAVENDIEPLLLKLGKIDKTVRGRILTDIEISNNRPSLF